MIRLTESDKIAAAKRAAHILTLCEEETDGAAVLSRAYCELLPDKTPWQGELMAERVTQEMQLFEAHYDAALRTGEAYAACQLEVLIQDLPLERQCERLHDIIRSMDAVSAAMLRTGFSAESWEEAARQLSEVADTTPYAGPYTEAARDGLLARAAEAVNRRLSDSAVERLAGERDGDPALAALREALDEKLMTAVTAMAVYTLAQSGELEGGTSELTLDEAVVAACKYMEEAQLYEAYRRKVLSYEQWRERLRALWRAVSVLLLLSAAALTAVLAYRAGNTAAALLITGAAVLLAEALVPVVGAAMEDMIDRAAGRLSDAVLHLPGTGPDLVRSISERVKQRAARSAARGALQEDEEVSGCAEDGDFVPAAET